MRWIVPAILSVILSVVGIILVLRNSKNAPATLGEFKATWLLEALMIVIVLICAAVLGELAVRIYGTG